MHNGQASVCANLNSGADCKKPWQQSTLSLFAFAFAAMAGASWRKSVSVRSKSKVEDHK